MQLYYCVAFETLFIHGTKECVIFVTHLAIVCDVGMHVFVVEA